MTTKTPAPPAPPALDPLLPVVADTAAPAAIGLPADLLGELEGAAPEIDAAARRIPRLTWNLRGTVEDATGEPARSDRLYWTDDNLPLASVEIVILDSIAFGARWSEMVGDSRVTWCRSADRETGERASDAPELPGQLVDCAACGRMRWGAARGGPKPVCAIYEDLAVFEPASGKIGVARFSVTGLAGIKGKGGLRAFQQRHVVGQWQRAGVRRDRPYVMMLVRLTPTRAKDLGDSRDYSVPVLDLVRFHAEAEIRELLALRRGVLDGIRGGAIVHEPEEGATPPAESPSDAVSGDSPGDPPARHDGSELPF